MAGNVLEENRSGLPELDQRVHVWLRRKNLLVNDLKSDDLGDARMILAVDDGGRLLAYCGADLPGRPLADIPASEVTELAGFFPLPPDIWFAPRVRGLVGGATHAILRGWKTPRDMRDALNQLVTDPTTAPSLLRNNPVIARFVWLWAMRTGVSPEGLILSGGELLAMCGGFFAEMIRRGRPPDMTRGFFVREVVQLALDGGMPTRLPDHADQRLQGDQAITPLYGFARGMTRLVVDRVHSITEGGPDDDKAVRDRLAPFATTP